MTITIASRALVLLAALVPSAFVAAQDAATWTGDIDAEITPCG